MRIALWHVHGGWTNAFVRGGHRYLMPVNPQRDAWGLGKATRSWPDVQEVPLAGMAEAAPDIVVLQRPEEQARYAQATGQLPGIDVPAVYVEHNTPPDPFRSGHPLAQSGLTIVHVSAFNRLVWDTGRARTAVIRHGIPDPGRLYVGDVPALAVVTNDPVRRMRAVGTDLLAPFASVGPLHVYGMHTDELPPVLGVPGELVRILGDLPPDRLHPSLARRRLYLHLTRWTSLGLSLLEAMFLGMPVLALATTEAPCSLPPEAGALSTDPADLMAAARTLLADPEEARRRGRAARAAALARHSLGRFLADWDHLLEDEVEHFAGRHHGRAAQAAASAAGKGPLS